MLIFLMTFLIYYLMKLLVDVTCLKDEFYFKIIDWRLQQNAPTCWPTIWPRCWILKLLFHLIHKRKEWNLIRFFMIRLVYFWLRLSISLNLISNVGVHRRKQISRFLLFFFSYRIHSSFTMVSSSTRKKLSIVF